MRAVIAALLLSFPLAAGDLRVGAAAVKITPPKGMPMAGYYYNRAADGVHDDLYAKALVIEKDGVRAALVACDLVALTEAVVEQARTLATKATGIPGANVMISATHAHTGPLLLGRGGMSKVEGEMLTIAQKYMAELPVNIAESVRQASAAAEPAHAAAGIGREDHLSFNRRFFMKDGTVAWNPGKLNPKIDHPAGPIDPAVPVVFFESLQRRPLATYVNFAMHQDTVGGTEFSADYAYALSQLLGRVRDPGMVTLFTIGTAGNINHIDVSTKAPQKGHEEAERIGTVLAGEVLKTFARMKPVEGGALAVRREVVRMPLPEIAPADLEKARRIAVNYGKPGAAPFMDLVRAFKAIDVAAREGRPLEAEVQVITLGDQVAWVGLPGEIFVELGLAIKKASPFPVTIIAELANGAPGYIPNREAWPQGAYEVLSARVAPGAGELMVDATLRLLKH